MGKDKNSQIIHNTCKWQINIQKSSTLPIIKDRIFAYKLAKNVYNDNSSVFE